MDYYKNTSLEKLDGEKWIDAYGYDGIYEVSTLGRIKSLGRWVRNARSERWVKEIIRKQVKVKDGRLTCPLSNGKTNSINVSALIYQSFNTDIDVQKKGFCVMHKNKNKSDNRLENLALETVAKSHRVNFKKGLLPHLAENNKKRTNEYKNLTHKTCKVCEIKLEIKSFEFGRNTCRKCKSKKQMESYYKSKK